MDGPTCLTGMHSLPVKKQSRSTALRVGRQQPGEDAGTSLELFQGHSIKAVGMKDLTTTKKQTQREGKFTSGLKQCKGQTVQTG